MEVMPMRKITFNMANAIGAMLPELMHIIVSNPAGLDALTSRNWRLSYWRTDHIQVWLFGHLAFIDFNLFWVILAISALTVSYKNYQGKNFKHSSLERLN